MVAENSRIDKLDAVLKKINSDKRFKTDNNSNIISKLSDKPLDVEKVSSGSLVLDDLLGGGIAKGRVIEIYGAESSGKCLDKDTTILTEDGLLTIEQIFNKFGQKTVNTTRVTDISSKNFKVVNEKGELEKVVALTHNGSKKVRTLNLKNGRELTATYNHPIRIINQNGNIVWKKVGNLLVGDTVVSYAKESSSIGKETVSLSIAEYLGYIISEGYVGDNNKVTFTNYYDNDVKEHYKELALKVAEELTPENPIDIKVYDHNDNEQVEFHINSNVFREALYKLGVDHVKSAEKTVPNVIKQGTTNIKQSFLSTLFEGDGWIEKSGNIGYASLSKELVKDVQLLLLTLGINSSINRRFNKHYQTESWTLLINGKNSYDFIEKIGFVSRRKKKIAEQRVIKNDSISYEESVPYINNIILDLVSNVGGDKQSKRITDDLVRDNITIVSEYLRVSQKRLGKIIEWTENKENISEYAVSLLNILKFYHNSNYSYSPVVSIEDKDKINTFDLALESTHSFIANGIVNHNTSIALTTVGNIQKEGGTAVFIDVENALDPKYARVLGVNTDELAVSQPNNAEQALDLLQELTETGVVDIIVLDSVAALVPTAELEGDTGDQTIGLLARIMSKSLKKLISSANRTGTTILMINQTRTDIGKFSPFGTPTTTSGGKALKFYASQRIEIKKGQQVKSDDAGSKNKIIGNEVKFKIVKNKIAPPFATGDSILTFNQGINKAADMLKIAPIYGVIERPNARTYVDAETGEPFAKSKAEALEVLEKDTELFNKLQTALLDKINNPDDHGNKDDSTVSDKNETVDDDEDDDFDIDDE